MKNKTLKPIDATSVGRRAYRKLVAQVLAEEPLCALRYEGICERLRIEVDHIVLDTMRHT